MKIKELKIEITKFYYYLQDPYTNLYLVNIAQISKSICYAKRFYSYKEASYYKNMFHLKSFNIIKVVR